MSYEIRFQSAPVITSGNFYAIIRQTSTLKLWNTNSNLFETENDGNWSLYALPLTEQGGTGFYYGDFPTLILAGVYDVITYKQTGNTPITTDVVTAEGDLNWPGAPVLTPTSTPDDWTTLGFVKNQLQLTVSTYDTIIQQAITSASRASRSYLRGRQILQTTWQEIRDGNGSDYLRTYHWPVTDLDNITFNLGLTNEQTFASSNFIVQPNTGIIKFSTKSTTGRLFYEGFQNLRLTYTSGFASIPQDIQMAVSIVVKNLMFTQGLLTSQVSSKKVKDVQVDYWNILTLDPANPLLGEARRILDFYQDKGL